MKQKLLRSASYSALLLPQLTYASFSKIMTDVGVALGCLKPKILLK